MCENNCMCQKEEAQHNPSCSCSNHNHEEQQLSETEQAYAMGFSDARRVFWEVFQYKASDARMVAKNLRELDKSSIEADTLDVLYSAYLHASDCIARDRREFPGYVEDEIEEVKWSSFD